MTREEEIQKIREDWEHDMKYPYCAWVKGQETFATFIDERTESKILPEKWEVHAPQSDIANIGVLLKENEGIREQVSVLSETYQDARLLYEVTIYENKRLRDGIIRLHEFTKFVPITDGEDEDPEEQASAFLNKLFDIQKMARELRQSLDGAK